MNTKAPSDLQINSHFALINSIGNAVLIETLKLAAYYVNHSDPRVFTRNWQANVREAQSCYAFVQGTGLEILIGRFGLEYNPENIRDTFNYCVRKTA